MFRPLFVDTLTEAFTALGLPAAVSESLAAAIVFIIVFSVLWGAGQSFFVPVVTRVLRERGVDEHARRPLLKLVRILVVFGAVGVAFGVAGYGNFLRSLATIAAAATLALGFALQDVIKNFVAGVFIFIEQPFRIGDWIEWDDYAGIVEDISLRVTRVRTFDNELLTVPNRQLTDGVIKNPVANEELRLKVIFGIGYDDDIDRATEIILEEAADHEGIAADPEPSVRVVELGDSDVGLQSRVWITNPSRSDFMRTRSEYVKAVKERFDAEGIDIPYPHRHLEGGIELADHPAMADTESDD